MTRVSHTLDRLEVSFDAPNVVANAGLLLTATLAYRLGLEALIDDTVKLATERRRIDNEAAAKADSLRHAWRSSSNSARSKSYLATLRALE